MPSFADEAKPDGPKDDKDPTRSQENVKKPTDEEKDSGKESKGKGGTDKDETEPVAFERHRCMLTSIMTTLLGLPAFCLLV